MNWRFYWVTLETCQQRILRQLVKNTNKALRDGDETSENKDIASYLTDLFGENSNFWGSVSVIVSSVLLYSSFFFFSKTQNKSNRWWILQNHASYVDPHTHCLFFLLVIVNTENKIKLYSRYWQGTEWAHLLGLNIAFYWQEKIRIIKSQRWTFPWIFCYVYMNFRQSTSKYHCW